MTLALSLFGHRLTVSYTARQDGAVVLDIHLQGPPVPATTAPASRCMLPIGHTYGARAPRGRATI